MQKEAVSPQAALAIREIVSQEMASFGQNGVEIEDGPDHNGEPSLWINVLYRDDTSPVDTKVMSGLVSKIRQRLWELGEERFPYVRHRFPDHQRVLGYD